MALSREKKEQIIAETAKLLAESKLTVVAKYAGTSVKSMQALKRMALESNTTVKIAKNRLVKKAMSQTAHFANTSTTDLTGQLLYTFNSADEVAPAKVLADFAKSEPQIEFVGAFTPNGEFMSADDVRVLAALPSRDQLRAQLVGVFKAPQSKFVDVLSANLRSVINVFSARSESIN